MIDIRVVSCSAPIGTETLYRIEERGFFGWRGIGYIWAANPEEALSRGYRECSVEMRTR